MTRSPAPNVTNVQPLLDTDVLRSFVAIAEYGSFTRAAKAVFRTPSALSMQIKRLETTLDQSLFVREARRVQLTAHGELLLRYARRLLQLNAEAVACFLTPALEGTVRIGTPDDVGTRVLPQVLSGFAASHPAVQVDVMAGVSRVMLERLDAGEIDLALVTAGSRDVDPERGEVVATEPLVWSPAPTAPPACASRYRWRSPNTAARGARALSTRSIAPAGRTAWPTAANTAPVSAPPFRPIWR